VDVSMLRDPVFIAKIVDFVIFVVALVWFWNRYGVGALEAQQEAQNKAIEDAAKYREEAAASLERAKASAEQAKLDAKRMVEVGTAQAARLIDEERAAAEAHARRVLAHASGELDRERYRVRRELLEETVEQAHAQAKEIVRARLDPPAQRALVGKLVDDLERSHAQ
jgi:F0F1-type ATP synthase membrane subunit b/b'